MPRPVGLLPLKGLEETRAEWRRFVWATALYVCFSSSILMAAEAEGVDMERAEFETLCLACANDLEPIYGEALREHVFAALQGDAQSGQSRHMDVWGVVGHITEVSNLLVGMFSAGVAYVTLKRTPRISPQTDAGASDIVVISADVHAFETAIDDGIKDFDEEQQAVAEKLKGEICAWLRQRDQR